MPELYCYILLGLIAGFSAGLLGIGGGSITVPILFFLLQDKTFPPDLLMQIVIGTTFGAMCLNSLVSMITHHVLNNIRWKMLVTMLPGLILGPVVGTLVATHLNSVVLCYIFGIVQCLLAIYFFFPTKPHEEGIPHPSPITLNSTSITIGTIGGALGIGGGVFLVPILSFLKVPLKRAIGTSAAATFIMITISTVCYFFLGLNEVPVSPGEVGFIYIPAFLAIGLSSVVGAPIGASLVQFLPTQPLKKIFAVVQAGLGIFLIVNS